MVWTRTSVYSYHNGIKYGPYGAYNYTSVREGHRVRSIYLGIAGRGTGSVTINPRPPEIEKPLETRQKVTSYSRETLTLTATIDGTEVWIGKDVTQQEREDLLGSIRRLPPSARAEVKSYEIYSGAGRAFKVGSSSFLEAGHWDKSTGTVRVFAKSKSATKWIKDFRNSDYIASHETGHALYDKLERQKTKEEYPREEADYIYWSYKNARDKRISEIRAKYDPEIKQLNDKYYALLDSDKEKSVKDRERASIMHQSETLDIERNRRIEQVRKQYDSDGAIEELRNKSMPLTVKMERFQEATREERGLTGYSESYLQSGKPTVYTENFAEATKIWYSAAYPQEHGEAIRTSHPKTYSAYRDLIQAETSGHSVSLKDRPIVRS